MTTPLKERIEDFCNYDLYAALNLVERSNKDMQIGKSIELCLKRAFYFITHLFSDPTWYNTATVQHIIKEYEDLYTEIQNQGTKIKQKSDSPQPISQAYQALLNKNNEIERLRTLVLNN